MEQHLPLPARGHRHHAADAAALPKCFVVPSTRNEKGGQNSFKCVSDEDTADCNFLSANVISTTVIGQLTRTRDPHEDFSRSGIFACARNSHLLHFPSQEAMPRHDGALHDLPTGANTCSIRNRSVLWCDDRNGTKKPGQSIPQTKAKERAADQESFSATRPTTGTKIRTMTTGLVLHNEFRPENVAVPARPRLGVSSSIYIPSHR